MKIILFILLLVAKGNFAYAPTQKEALFDIAAQCPITGGKAVYLARSLYENIGHISYNDIALCAVQGVNFRTQKPPIAKQLIISNIAYTIQPNPASNYAILKSATALDSDGLVTLYDVYGRIVGVYAVQKDAVQVIILTQDLSSGIYTCKLSVNNESKFVAKLSVIK
jgi:hypothetical protein